MRAYHVLFASFCDFVSIMIACIFVDLLFIFGKLVFSYNGLCIKQWRPGG